MVNSCWLQVVCCVLVGGIDGETGQAASDITLPLDLQKAVEEDNMMFAQEIVDWDNEQKKKSQQQQEPDVVLVEEHMPG